MSSFLSAPSSWLWRPSARSASSASSGDAPHTAQPRPRPGAPTVTLHARLRRLRTIASPLPSLCTRCPSPEPLLPPAGRFYSGSQIFLRALYQSAEALLVPLFVMLIVCCCGGGIVYSIEFEGRRSGLGIRNTNDTQWVQDVPQAMWLVLVTMTTVGYGDLTPGSACTAVLTPALPTAHRAISTAPTPAERCPPHRVCAQRSRTLPFFPFPCYDVNALYRVAWQRAWGSSRAA